jgi:hypothetical protein
MAELAIVDLTLTRSREKKLGVELTWGEGYYFNAITRRRLRRAIVAA